MCSSLDILTSWTWITPQVVHCVTHKDYVSDDAHTYVGWKNACVVRLVTHPLGILTSVTWYVLRRPPHRCSGGRIENGKVRICMFHTRLNYFMMEEYVRIVNPRSEVFLPLIPF